MLLTLGYFTFGSNARSVEKHICGKIEKVSELVPLKYKYSKVAKYENSKKIFGVNLPFTTNSFIIIYVGEIIVSIDLSKSKFSVNNKNINVFVPNSKIISNNLKQESIKVWDVEKRIFNWVKLTDLTEFTKEQKLKAKEDAINEEILEEGNKYAEEFIAKFVKGILDNNSDYKIKIIFSDDIN